MDLAIAEWMPPGWHPSALFSYGMVDNTDLKPGQLNPRIVVIKNVFITTTSSSFYMCGLPEALTALSSRVSVEFRTLMLWYGGYSKSYLEATWKFFFRSKCQKKLCLTYSAHLPLFPYGHWEICRSIVFPPLLGCQDTQSQNYGLEVICVGLIIGRFVF